MQAVVVAGDGTVSIQNREAPRPEADEVLVRVVGAGCNRADILQRDGLYPAPPGVPADIPGLEFAGIVEAVGPAVLSTQPGDRVMGITGGGAQAEYLKIREDMCVSVPPDLTLIEAAALPEAFFTAFEALVRRGGVYPGATVYVNAAGSGVGTAVVQLSKALGARVVGTTRTPDKLKALWPLGLDAGVLAGNDESAEALASRVVEAIDTEVDVAIDLLGGPNLPTCLGVLRPDGTAVALGMISGTQSVVNLPQMITKRLTVVATSLRARANRDKAVLARDFQQRVVPFLTSGALAPILDSTVKLADAAEAYATMEENRTMGKVVLEIAAE